MEEETKKESIEKSAEVKTDDVKDNKIWALLSYLGVLVLFPLFGKKDSTFAQFHAKQGLVILIGWALSWLPFGPIIAIIVIIFSIMGIVNVLNGEQKKLPVIGDLAEKINL